MGKLVKLPWPPAKTSPNASRQGDYRGKAKAAKSYKAICAWECKAQKVPKMSCDRLFVTVTYHPPINGRIDWDNMAARCKQGFDAVSEALGVDDGLWWPVLSDRGEKVKGGCVVLTFSEVAPVIEYRGTIS